MPLNDCGGGGGPLALDTSYVMGSITLLGTTLSQNGVQVPVLQVTWTALDSTYITHVEIEYQPVDGSTPLRTDRVPKENLGHTAYGVTPGKDLLVRYRAVGLTAVGNWSGYQSITIPAAFVSSDVSPTSTIAQTVSNLSGTVSNNLTYLSGQILIEADIRFNADAALTIYIDGEVDDLIDYVDGEIFIVNGTISTLTTTISSTYVSNAALAANNASLTTSIQTAADAKYALGTTVSTLSSTVGGHTTTLTTYGQNILDITGSLNQSWGVLFDGGGRMSGLRLQNVGGPLTVVTTLKLYVDALLMYNPATGVDEPFLRADATGLFIGNDRVVTESVGVGQLSKGYIATLASDFNWSSVAGTTQTVFTLAGVVKDRADSDIRVQMCLCNRSAGQYGPTYTVRYVGPVSGTFSFVPHDTRPTVTLPTVGTTARSTVNQLWVQSGLPAGTYTFYIDILNWSGWTPGTGYFQAGSLMEVREAKRAA